MQIETTSCARPTWQELQPEIRNAWIEQTLAFYSPGTVTREDAIEAAAYDYSQAETIEPPKIEVVEIE
jgi:hypothetical protein